LNFVDQALIRAHGGRGGSGCVAFRREKYVPRGGPSGGDGGHGGSVWLVGDEGLNTLYHLHGHGLYAAERGRHGEGSNRTGRSGGDLEVRVPLGTQAFDAETGELLGELLADGGRLRVARGGRGGRGNARFATATNQAPRRADPGEEGEERALRLELKLLADVGVIGLPNAGKSTLISKVSAAQPKIADYPFTTLVPQLGVVGPPGEVAFGDPLSEPFVIADLPGLIAGAAEGAGLGHRFLRHVERCRVLAHLVDLAAFEDDAGEDLATVERELEAFDPALLERPRLVVGSKADAARAERRAAVESAARERGLPYLEISAVTGAGLEPLRRELAVRLAAARAAEKAAAAEKPVAAERSAGGEAPGRAAAAGEEGR
jgi:GTP-binding protein